MLPQSNFHQMRSAWEPNKEAVMVVAVRPGESEAVTAIGKTKEAAAARSKMKDMLVMHQIVSSAGNSSLEATPTRTRPD